MSDNPHNPAGDSPHVTTGTGAPGTPITPDPGPPAHGPSNPEVSHEHSDVNVGAILWTGAVVIAVAVVLHLVVYWMFIGFKRREEARDRGVPPLTAERNKLPVDQRVQSVPSPRLEGIEPSGIRLVVKPDEGEEVTLDMGPDARVWRGGEEIRPFDLSEGEKVSVAYRSIAGKYNKVLSLSSPPAEPPPPAPGTTEDRNLWLRGTIVTIDPKSVSERRQWSEARLKRYGWVKGEEGKVARIPLDRAMQAILSGDLEKKWLPSRPGGKDPAGGRPWRPMPSQTNSGRGPTGEAR